MKNQTTLLLLVLAAAGIALVVVASRSQEQAQAPAPPPAPTAPVAPGELPADHPPLTGGTVPAGPLERGGRVIEALPTSRYVILQVEAEEGPVWLATGAVEVAEGDSIRWGTAVPMDDFYSQTLDRTFDQIRLVNGIEVVGGA
jgi:hypothetical protein